MGLPPGRTNNINGRPKGSKNRDTQFKVFVKQLLKDNYEQMQADLKELEPKDRLMILTKLAAFAEPTLRSVESRVTTESVSPEKIDELWNQMINEQ